MPNFRGTEKFHVNDLNEDLHIMTINVLSLRQRLCVGAESEAKIVTLFHSIVIESKAYLDPSLLAKMTILKRGQLGTSIQIKWLMISCLT